MLICTYLRATKYLYILQTETEAKRPEYPGHSASWNPNLNIGKLDTGDKGK